MRQKSASWNSERCFENCNFLQENIFSSTITSIRTWGISYILTMLQWPWQILFGNNITLLQISRSYDKNIDNSWLVLGNLPNVQCKLKSRYPKDPRIVPHPLATLKCSHALTSWTCGDFFFKLNNSLGQVVTQSKKSLHKSNSFRRKSISNLPGGMALFVGL